MKTKALISFVVTAKLICVFVFANEKIGFSHTAAQLTPLHFIMEPPSVTPQPFYNTIVGVETNLHLSYPILVIKRVKCIAIKQNQS